MKKRLYKMFAWLFGCYAILFYLFSTISEDKDYEVQNWQWYIIGSFAVFSAFCFYAGYRDNNP